MNFIRVVHVGQRGKVGGTLREDTTLMVHLSFGF
jgi:hypothetical protein